MLTAEEGREPPQPLDTKLFTTWWAMVQGCPSLVEKARQQLPSFWSLSDEHLQDGVWQAVVGLAERTSPPSAHLAITHTRPWLLPGLQPVLHTLEKVECQCQCPWHPDWMLVGAESVGATMVSLLGVSCPPANLTITLPHCHSSDAPYLAPILVQLIHSPRYIDLLLEEDFKSDNHSVTSDEVVMEVVNQGKRIVGARVLQLACHIGEVVITKFLQEEPNQNEPLVRESPVLAQVRFLQVLRIKVSETGTIEALNNILPHLELLEELDLHLALCPAMCVPEDLPRLTYCKEGLRLQLPHLKNSLASWAGEVTAALSEQYKEVWLTRCHMTAFGGEKFVEELAVAGTRVETLCVFSLTGRVSPSEFIRISAQAACLPGHTSLHW